MKNNPNSSSRAIRPFLKSVALLAIGLAVIKLLLRYLRDPAEISLASVFSSPMDHPEIKSLSEFDRHRLAAVGLTLRAAKMWADAAARFQNRSKTADLIMRYAQDLSRLIDESFKATASKVKTKYPEIGEEIGKQMDEAAENRAAWEKFVLHAPAPTRPKDPMQEFDRSMLRAIESAQREKMFPVRDSLLEAYAKFKKIQNERNGNT